MKKMLKYIFIFIFLYGIQYANACIVDDLGKDVPNNFKVNCYEKVGELMPTIIKKDECNNRNTFLVNTTKKIDTFISDNKIIPFKLYKNPGNFERYSIDNLHGDLNYLKDSNYKTFLVYDEEKNKNNIKIVFNKELKAGTYKFNFSFKANYRNAQISISKDGKDFYFVPQEKLADYDLKYINIKFSSSVKHITPPEKIKIYELSFISNTYKYLILTKGIIEAYSTNICKNNYLNLSNNKGTYNLDINTPVLNLNLKNNLILNPNKKEDRDNDGVIDSEDNCPSVYNPMQKDKDGNNKGDLCSDDDGDSIIGYKDNCINIPNIDQKDINRNGVGDVCEFDKDKDGVFDSLDNCINTKNPDQLDSDKDGIGDKCDNCKMYNPRQIDKNKNSIGDICEQVNKTIEENDKDKDGIIDLKDNCKKIANKDQLDSDKDGIGDKCDNCINIQNNLQIDKDENGIGDMCEDSDNDGYVGYLDNCIDIKNPDQKDSDNDGIGDLCEDDDGDSILFTFDNCPYDYNPAQKDTDKDGIGDKCDKGDNRFIESNKGVFIGLLIFIVLIFGGGIFFMLRKLKKDGQILN